jgi:hypothetical protein
MNKTAIDTLNAIAFRINEGLTHFLVQTEIVDSTIIGRSRVARQLITSSTLVAIVGGIIVDNPDSYLAMPLGNGIYLHQVNDVHKATVNHSCEPNCMIQGFNRLVAIRSIYDGEELTIDYGAVSIGNGSVIIDDCLCGTESCRGIIRSSDYKKLNIDHICAYGQYARRNDT